MRIGLNLLFLRPSHSGGTETYAKGLLAGLAALDTKHSFFVFLNRECRDWAVPRSTAFEPVPCPVSATSALRRYFFEQVRFPSIVSRYHLDLLHSLGYVAPLRLACPSVVTIHDLNYKALSAHMNQMKRWALGAIVPAVARRARHVITDSEASRVQIISEIRLPPERVSTIHLAPRIVEPPAPGTVVPRLNIFPRDAYAVCFTSPSHHKNLAHLFQAFAAIQPGLESGFCLVCIGNEPTTTPGKMRHAPPGILFTGFLPDQSVADLVRGARFLVLPSIYEGFGLPALEAMTLGTPVICSDIPPLREICADAAEYFDPHSIDAIAATVSRTLSNPVRLDEMRRRGRELANAFSWEKTARATLRVYETPR